MKQAIKEITASQRNATEAFNALEDAKDKVRMRYTDLVVAEKKLAEKFKELRLTTLDILFESYQLDLILPSGAWVITNFRVDGNKVRCYDIILPDFVSIFSAEYDGRTQCWTGAIYYPVNQEISDRDGELLDNPIFDWRKSFFNC